MIQGTWTLLYDIIDNRRGQEDTSTLGDLIGQFTSHTPRSSRIVDYFKASITLSNCIHSMRVHGLSIFSDHCMISTKIKLFNDICKGYRYHCTITHRECGCNKIYEH